MIDPAELDAFRREVGPLALDPERPGIARGTVDPTVGYLFGNRSLLLATIINEALRIPEPPHGAPEMPGAIWVQLSTDGEHIRKWGTAFFEGGFGYVADRRWPAGAEREAEHRAELARKAEPIPISGTIAAGDLEQLDELILLLDAMADHGLTGNHYDFAWNLRNQLVPFPEGHPLYAPGDD